MQTDYNGRLYQDAAEHDKMRALGKLCRESHRLVPLQAKAAQYLNMLAQLGVAGVRIDAAKHMNKWDLGNILQVCLVFFTL